MKRSYVNILICIGYGLVTLMQMLNNKYLFNTMNFKLYSMSFFIQKYIVILVYLLLGKAQFSIRRLVQVILFSMLMCTTNLLSSYSLSTLPLGAFAAFKKLSIVFVMIVGFIMKSPHQLQKMQYYCIFGITVGAFMVGYKDFFGGNILGYFACMGSLLSQAIALHYARNLALNDSFSPSSLLFYSAILSEPYYLGTMIYGNQISGMIEYLSNVPTGFYGMFILMLILGPTSQLAVNQVSMRISPFQKSTISNIKDIFLVFVSIKILRDFDFMLIPLTGTFLIFFCSILFSLPDLLREDKQQFSKIPEQQTQDSQNYESIIEEQKKCDNEIQQDNCCKACDKYYVKEIEQVKKFCKTCNHQY